jgi:hypothetical protein
MKSYAAESEAVLGGTKSDGDAGAGASFPPLGVSASPPTPVPNRDVEAEASSSARRACAVCGCTDGCTWFPCSFSTADICAKCVELLILEAGGGPTSERLDVIDARVDDTGAIAELIVHELGMSRDLGWVKLVGSPEVVRRLGAHLYSGVRIYSATPRPAKV